MTKKALHLKFVECGGNIKKLMRECALMLPEIDREKIWKIEGFESVYEYAGKLANMSRYQVELALWTMRKIEHMPALLKVVREKGIHAVRPVAKIATKETEIFWAEKASTMTVRGLETYVKEIRKTCHVTSFDSLVVLKLNLPQALAQRLDRVSKRADFETILDQFLKKVEAEEAVQKPEKIETNSRYIPVKIQRYVKNRTGEKCAYPECHQPIHQLHNTQRWALEHVHDPDRLQPLCPSHNELAHLGLIENENQLPEVWHLRANPDTDHPKYNIDKQVALYSRRGG